jgi:hypothetical protein
MFRFAVLVLVVAPGGLPVLAGIALARTFAAAYTATPPAPFLGRCVAACGQLRWGTLVNDCRKLLAPRDVEMVGRHL